MIINGYDLIDKYRRLRILYNRVMLLGEHPFYSYWASFTFPTALGPRKFICSLPFIDTPEEFMDFYYERDDIILFKIEINRKRYNFKGYFMSEQEAWLAIYELEELSYKLLERSL